MISSRKQDKVANAVSKLEKEMQGCTVRGVVCHVSKPEHRKNLIEEVGMYRYFANTCMRVGKGVFREP